MTPQERISYIERITIVMNYYGSMRVNKEKINNIYRKIIQLN
jgi:hypothetical protein